jgi:hypothetical protein
MTRNARHTAAGERFALGSGRRVLAPDDRKQMEWHNVRIGRARNDKEPRGALTVERTPEDHGCGWNTAASGQRIEGTDSEGRVVSGRRVGSSSVWLRGVDGFDPLGSPFVGAAPIDTGDERLDPGLRPVSGAENLATGDCSGSAPVR